MKLTINELADKVNEIISNSGIEYSATDKRIKNEVSVRRIQTYLSQGLLDKPIKEGNRAYFNEEHVNKLLLLRQYSVNGLTDRSLKNITTSSYEYNVDNKLNSSITGSGAGVDSFMSNNKPDEDLKIQAMSAIRSLGKSAVRPVMDFPGDYISSVSDVKSQLQNKNRIWQEFQLNNEGTAFLKVEVGSQSLNNEEILKRVKDLLNIKGEGK